MAAAGLHGQEVFGIVAALCYTSAGVCWSDVSAWRDVAERRQRCAVTHVWLECADDQTAEGGRAERRLAQAVCSPAQIPGVFLDRVRVCAEAGPRAAVRRALRCSLEPARRDARGVRPLAPPPRA